MTEINLRRPKKLSEYLQHEYAVKFAQTLIERNFYQHIRAINITGSSGSGKSLIASLIARTTLCENREEGSSEACGECPVCLGEDTTNIEHYTISSSAAARERVEHLKEIANSMPVVKNPRGDRNYRFIILDEMELASPELAATLLDPIEYTPATTVWIIISMDPKKLEKRDPAIKEAIDSRCVWLPLPRFNDDVVATNLVSSYPELDWDAAMAIAKCSGGNMRKGWNELVFFRSLAEIEDIDEDLIYKSRMGGANDESRRAMWLALQEGRGKEVVSIVEGWSKSADSETIATLLEEDLLDLLDSPQEAIQGLLGGLARWYTSPIYGLSTVLLQFLGRGLGMKSIVERERVSLGWSGVTPSLNIKDLLAPKQPKSFFSMNDAELITYCKSLRV